MSLRKHIRMRKEYIYRKSLEGKDKEQYEKKRQIREALAAGKPIPTELRDEQGKLRQELDRDDEFTIKPKTHMDDEYANAGVRDPKICVTTSSDPSSRLKQFAKEVRLMFPNSQRINRGNVKLAELVDTCRSNDFTDIVIVQEHRGEPDALVVCHLPYGPTATFSLTNAVMRHDIEDCGTMSEAYPHLIFDNFNTALGERVSNILKYLFPVPKPESTRVLTFSNNRDFISFRHHTFKKLGGESNTVDKEHVELSEVGPRFEMQLFQIKLGTVDDRNAEMEWVRHTYTNTAKKRRLL
ncbi:U3 small nucleolar ribonucleoprotein protein IMP4 [Hondaea fermentalgiana]|uniref:U3 small nucleolar ribonucleoprotein protein IMP4 n=1 Tax=Hondaea fermentalgiana TaxID=2315210 RepID=A0A2R5GWV0_9STRA|nr:U3 small nucleolar ribonucleoprotein protein IMP4 [Hondaea fermentalgiana]|eukprot:GBG34809.1 U3 small nucleolar ribonucleoprotein protein IMP4 [Hondaea fermentalgiana]